MMTAMMTTDAPMTASSGPTVAAMTSSGRASASPDKRVIKKTPFKAFTEPPIMRTMRKGQIRLRGSSCKLIYDESKIGSRPVKFAKVLAGMPIEPYVVGNGIGYQTD